MFNLTSSISGLLAQAPEAISPIIVWAGLAVIVVICIPVLISRLLRTVDAGTIRIVSWLRGATKVYRGPCKSTELPLFTTGTTIPSRAINIDLEVADQTADVDATGLPRPIKVRVLASAIVSVGDTNEMVKTAANKFFSKPDFEQTSILTDLLTSTGRRAINLLHHDELFNAKAVFPITPGAGGALPVQQLTSTLAKEGEEDDRLAIIIKSSCSRELQDLGLVFNSLNIKEVQSEVAEARRRQSAVEAKANADIVTADQERRAKEAQLGAEQAVSDKQRELDSRKAENAAMVAEADAKKQVALGKFREAELRATLIAQAQADAEKVKVAAEASAEAEAIRLRTVATAQAEAIRQVNAAIQEGGDAYLALRRLELVPQVAPFIAEALSKAKLVNISSDGRGAAGGATDQIMGVIQTVIAANLVNSSLKTDSGSSAEPVSEPEYERRPAQRRPEPTPAPAPTPEPQAPPKLKPPVSFQIPKDGGNSGGR